MAGKGCAQSGTKLRIRLNGNQFGYRRVPPQGFGDLPNAGAHFKYAPTQIIRKIFEQGVSIVFGLVQRGKFKIG